MSKNTGKNKGNGKIISSSEPTEYQKNGETYVKRNFDSLKTKFNTYKVNTYTSVPISENRFEVAKRILKYSRTLFLFECLAEIMDYRTGYSEITVNLRQEIEQAGNIKNLVSKMLVQLINDNFIIPVYSVSQDGEIKPIKRTYMINPELRFNCESGTHTKGENHPYHTRIKDYDSFRYYYELDKSI